MGDKDGDTRLKEFLVILSRRIGYRLSRLIDIAEYAGEAEVIEVKEGDGKIYGIRLRFKSETRDDVFHYALVGRYGAKCTCEANTLGNELCKHIVAGLIIMEAISLGKYGKDIDIDEMKWLESHGDAQRRGVQNPGTSSNISDGGPPH
ncbi:hypothetical protein GCM10007981_08430 [Thermocladium modestius]|uniref:SWIM-type domain-containing protein n=1 Tax=Thermocladium modestius TaxID=62609 RepID=A0A830GXS1_9CREN|nr:hypothetical protein [Thermocladium modestius]GGP20422.1 hypothetical protein GCM10007981_08430 [Thermocladium modestius]